MSNLISDEERKDTKKIFEALRLIHKAEKTIQNALERISKATPLVIDEITVKRVVEGKFSKKFRNYTEKEVYKVTLNFEEPYKIKMEDIER